MVLGSTCKKMVPAWTCLRQIYILLLNTHAHALLLNTHTQRTHYQFDVIHSELPMTLPFRKDNRQTHRPLSGESTVGKLKRTSNIHKYTFYGSTHTNTHMHTSTAEHTQAHILLLNTCTHFTVKHTNPHTYLNAHTFNCWTHEYIPERHTFNCWTHIRIHILLLNTCTHFTAEYSSMLLNQNCHWQPHSVKDNRQTQKDT